MGWIQKMSAGTQIGFVILCSIIVSFMNVPPSYHFFYTQRVYLFLWVWSRLFLMPIMEEERIIGMQIEL